MAIFKKNHPAPEEPDFGVPYDDEDLPGLYDDVPAYDDHYMTSAYAAAAPQTWGSAPETEALEAEEEEERLENSRIRARTAAGLFDFFGVILGAVACLLLIAVLIGLVHWLVNDIGDLPQIILQLI